MHDFISANWPARKNMGNCKFSRLYIIICLVVQDDEFKKYTNFSDFSR